MHRHPAPGRWKPATAVVIVVLIIAPVARTQTHEDPALDFEVFAEGFDEPTAFAFVDSTELFVLERATGRVRWVRDDAATRTVLRLDVDATGRRGGLGLALHPDFPTTPQAFVFYSASEDGVWVGNRLIRATFNGNRLTKPTTLMEFTAAAGSAADGDQNGGALGFGSDGMLYALVGALGLGDETARVEQNGGTVSSGAGAILRIDPDGSIPVDNPFVSESDAALHKWFAYGFRDGVGLAFDPVTGSPWISERGPQGWDEINRLFGGFNGGWSKIVGPDARDVSVGASGAATFDKGDLVRLSGSTYRDPAFSWLQGVGVGGLAFVDTNRYGKTLKNQLVVGDDDGNLYLFELLNRAKKRRRLQLSGPLKDRVADDDAERTRNLWAQDLGAVSHIAVGPDSALYVADRDGGRILRLIDKVDESARYRVTFDATWDATTHPDPGFPAGPHFSGLIGATHGADADFWEAGTTASDGIKNMAETGSKSPLNSELQAAIDAGTAEVLLSGGGIGLSPGDVGIEFDISSDHSLVTLVSMLAPSPDWFVGVDSLDLIVNGDWVDQLNVDLFPYDAGTDSGTTYTSANAATSPRQAIARLTGAPFLVNGEVPKVGTFRFERLE